MAAAEGTRWGQVAIAVAAGVIAAVHFGKVAPAMPALRDDLAMSLVTGGWAMSLFSAAGMVAGIAVGAAADWLGARRALVLGLLLLALGGALSGAAPNATWLLWGRLAEGLGFLAAVIAAPVLVVRASAGGARTLSLAVWSTYLPAGVALAMLAVPAVVEDWGWRAAWWAAALVTLAWAGLVAARLAPDRAARSAAGPSAGLAHNLRATLAEPGAWILALVFGAYTLQWISLMAWLPTFLLEQRGLSHEWVGLVTAAVVLFNIPGNLAVGPLLNRGLPRWGLLAIGALGMGGCTLALFSPALPDATRLLACLGFSCFGGLIPGAALTGAPEVAPSQQQIGTVNGMLVQGSQLGQLLGPPAMAAVVTLRGQWQDTQWMMAAGVAATLALAFAYRRWTGPAEGPGRARA